MRNGDRTTIAVNPIVIKMLEKLQAFYQLNGKKKTYGEIVEDLVTAEFSALGLELNGEREMEVIT